MLQEAVITQLVNSRGTLSIERFEVLLVIDIRVFFVSGHFSSTSSIVLLWLLCNDCQGLVQNVLPILGSVNQRACAPATVRDALTLTMAVKLRDRFC